MSRGETEARREKQEGEQRRGSAVAEAEPEAECNEGRPHEYNHFYCKSTSKEK